MAAFKYHDRIVQLTHDLQEFSQELISSSLRHFPNPCNPRSPGGLHATNADLQFIALKEAKASAAASAIAFMILELTEDVAAIMRFGTISLEVSESLIPIAQVKGYDAPALNQQLQTWQKLYQRTVELFNAVQFGSEGRSAQTK